jgi:hypothetical protein
VGAALELNELISTRIETLWPTGIGASCPIEMPNTAEPVVKTKRAWARFSFLSDADPEPESAGPGSAEYFYERLQLEIFAKLEDGRNFAFQLADAWADLWRPAADGTPPVAEFTFFPTRIIVIGRSGSEFKLDCLTAFERSYQP